MTGITTGSDGMRLKLDIPETYMHEGAKLLTMRGKLLKVTIEVQEQGDSTPQKKANY